jgi:hypothetical protein
VGHAVLPLSISIVDHSDGVDGICEIIFLSFWFFEILGVNKLFQFKFQLGYIGVCFRNSLNRGEIADVLKLLISGLISSLDDRLSIFLAKIIIGGVHVARC